MTRCLTSPTSFMPPAETALGLKPVLVRLRAKSHMRSSLCRKYTCDTCATSRSRASSRNWSDLGSARISMTPRPPDAFSSFVISSVSSPSSRWCSSLKGSRPGDRTWKEPAGRGAACQCRVACSVRARCRRTGGGQQRRQAGDERLGVLAQLDERQAQALRLSSLGRRIGRRLGSLGSRPRVQLLAVLGRHLPHGRLRLGGLLLHHHVRRLRLGRDALPERDVARRRVARRVVLRLHGRHHLRRGELGGDGDHLHVGAHSSQERLRVRRYTLIFSQLSCTAMARAGGDRTRGARPPSLAQWRASRTGIGIGPLVSTTRRRVLVTGPDALTDIAISEAAEWNCRDGPRTPGQRAGRGAALRCVRGAARDAGELGASHAAWHCACACCIPATYLLLLAGLRARFCGRLSLRDGAVWARQRGA